MSCFSDTQAKELWKARWRRTPLKRLVAKYGTDPRRFYEVWTEEENAGTRLAAFSEFQIEDSELAVTTDPSPHEPKLHVVRRQIGEPQGNLFD